MYDLIGYQGSTVQYIGNNIIYMIHTEPSLLTINQKWLFICPYEKFIEKKVKNENTEKLRMK